MINLQNLPCFLLAGDSFLSRSVIEFYLKVTIAPDTNQITKVEQTTKTQIEMEIEKDSDTFQNIQKAIEDGLKHQLPLKEIKYPLICMGSTFAYPGSFKYTIEGSDELYTYQMVSTEFSDLSEYTNEMKSTQSSAPKYKMDIHHFQQLKTKLHFPLKINAEFGNDALTQE